MKIFNWLYFNYRLIIRTIQHNIATLKYILLHLSYQYFHKLQESKLLHKKILLSHITSLYIIILYS